MHGSYFGTSVEDIEHEHYFWYSQMMISSLIIFCVENACVRRTSGRKILKKLDLLENFDQKHPNADKLRILDKLPKFGHCPGSWNKSKDCVPQPSRTSTGVFLQRWCCTHRQLLRMKLPSLICQNRADEIEPHVMGTYRYTGSILEGAPLIKPSKPTIQLLFLGKRFWNNVQTFSTVYWSLANHCIFKPFYTIFHVPLTLYQAHRIIPNGRSSVFWTSIYPFMLQLAVRLFMQFAGRLRWSCSVLFFIHVGFLLIPIGLYPTNLFRIKNVGASHQIWSLECCNGTSWLIVGNLSTGTITEST